MKRIRGWYLFSMLMIFQFFPWRVWASGEGLDIPESLEKKVSLEGLSGISLFFAKTYNDNLSLYALICTVLMAAVGVSIAYVVDLILKAIGMEVGKIEHKE